MTRVFALVLIFFAAFGGRSSAAATVFDWTGPLEVGGESYSLTVGGVKVTGVAYVAEVSGGDDAVFGPFATSDGSAGFIQTSSGLGLTVAPSATDAPISGAEFGGANIRPGFDGYNYLSGDRSIASLNFAVFEFSQPVRINTLTVDDVSNFPRDAWVASGVNAPDFTGGLAAALDSFSVFNAPDTEASDGRFTTVFEANAPLRWLLVGAPVAQDLGEIEAGSGQFYITAFEATPAPIPAPAALPLFMSAAGASLCIGLRRKRNRSGL